jgi:hypothetical protein
MPDVYGPFDAVTWSQAQWYRDAYARELSGVFGTNFTASTAGDLALTVSGLTVTMALGRAHVRGAGYERTGTAWSSTLPTNTNANPRIDRLVLRRDLAAKTVLPAILQGTPAATPAVPALTQAEDGVWELPLHRVQVPGGSGTTLTNIVDERAPGDIGALRRNVLWPLLDHTSGMITEIAAGWALTTLALRRIGVDQCSVDTLWTKTGTALTVPADGNIGDVTLGRLNDAYVPAVSLPLSHLSTGRLVGGWMSTGGGIVLASTTPGSNIAASDTVRLAAVYPLAASALPAY